VSSDPAGRASGPPGVGPGGAPGEPSEDDRSEIGQRAAYEAELSRITSADMMLQAAVSLLNIGGRRLGLSAGAEGERDLEQVRDAIDGVRALMPVLERGAPKELRPLRDALSQLQMAYARETQAGGDAAQPGGSEAQTGAADAQRGGAHPGQAGQARPVEKKDAQAGEDKPAGPGPAQSSGRLWVPGS
jgi:hypothetical protein